MGKTLYVAFRGQGFWAFDVISSVFLKYLIDAAESDVADREEPWLALAIDSWRFNTHVSDCGLFLDDNWDPWQVQTVRELATAACGELAMRNEITSEEMLSWSVYEGGGVDPRNCASITGESARSLGLAIIQILEGTLPEPPPGTWWFFGTDNAPHPIAKRSS